MFKFIRRFIKFNAGVIGVGVALSYKDPSLNFNFFNTKDNYFLKKKVLSNIYRDEINNNKPVNSNRDNTINNMKNTSYDIVIIGGGSAGAGAFSAATRKGLNACLIEKEDFSSGTSSRSTKIAHGGIRYLQEVFKNKEPFEKLSLVKESLSERDRVLKSGVFINNQVEIQIPSRNIYQGLYHFYGSSIYHLIYIFSNIYFKIDYNLKYFINRIFSLEFDNNINSGSLLGLISFPRINIHTNNKAAFNSSTSVSIFEGQFIDSRQNVLTLLNNNNTQSNCCNYIEFIRYIYNNDKSKILGVEVIDKVKNSKFVIKAKSFANCTGVVSDLNLDDKDKNLNEMLLASKGTHIVVNKGIFKYIDNKGIMIPKTSDGRILFILPYQGKYIVGTTDENVKKSLKVKPLQKEIDWIVRELCNYFDIKDNNIIYSNITSAWSGVRPIVYYKNTANKTVNQNETLDLKAVSRKHIIYKGNSDNLYSLMGGKWTIYLKMGEELIDKMIDNIDDLSIYRGKIYKINAKLFGSFESNNKSTLSYSDERKMFKLLASLIKELYPKIPEFYINKLISLYGVNAFSMLEKGKINNTNKPIDDKEKYLSKYFYILESELDYCIENEFVVKPNDFLLRRRSIGFLNSEITKLFIPIVTDLIGKKLNWNNNKINNETIEAQKRLEYMI